MKLNEKKMMELENQEKNTLSEYILGAVEGTQFDEIEYIKLTLPFSKTGIEKVNELIQKCAPGLSDVDSKTLRESMLTNLVTAAFYYLCEFSIASVSSIHATDEHLRERASSNAQEIIDLMNVFKTGVTIENKDKEKRFN